MSNILSKFLLFRSVYLNVLCIVWFVNISTLNKMDIAEVHKSGHGENEPQTVELCVRCVQSDFASFHVISLGPDTPHGLCEHRAFDIKSRYNSEHDLCILQQRIIPIFYALSYYMEMYKEPLDLRVGPQFSFIYTQFTETLAESYYHRIIRYLKILYFQWCTAREYNKRWPFNKSWLEYIFLIYYLIS